MGALIDKSYVPDKYSGDLQIVCLKNADELSEEATRMQHCVATYVSKCMFERTQIFSVRNEIGDSLSTFEIKLTDDPDGKIKYSLIQHKGYQNSNPIEECEMIVKKFMIDLIGANVDINQSANDIPDERYENFISHEILVRSSYSVDNYFVGQMMLDYYSPFMQKT